MSAGIRIEDLQESNIDDLINVCSSIDQIVNEWERHVEALRLKNSSLIVNARVIHTFFTGTEKFKQEIRQTMG
jgi:hypothetical protein